MKEGGGGRTIFSSALVEKSLRNASDMLVVGCVWLGGMLVVVVEDA